MATPLSLDEAKQALTEVKLGQQLLINYYGNEETAYFIGDLPEPENEGKIMVIMESDRLQDIVDINEGALLQVTDNTPYSDVRFKKMMTFGPTIEPDHVGSERPNISAPLAKMEKDTYEKIHYLVAVSEQLSTSDLADEELTMQINEETISLQNTDLQTILKDIQHILTEKSSWLESDEQIEVISTLEMKLSEHLSVESVTQKAETPEKAEDNLLDEEVVESLETTSLEEESLQMTESQDMLVEPLEQPLNEINEFDAGDAVNYMENVIDRGHAPINPDLHNQGVNNAAGGGSNVNLGQIAGGILSSAGSIISSSMGSLANLTSQLDNTTKLSSEKSSARLKDKLDSLANDQFTEKCDDFDALNNDIEEIMSELRTNQDTADLIDKANMNSDGDIELERDISKAKNELNTHLEKNHPELMDELKLAYSALADKANKLEEFKDESLSESHSAQEQFNQVVKKLKSRTEDVEKVSHGDDNLTKLIEKVMHMLEKFAQKLKELTTSNTQESPKDNVVKFENS